MASNSNIEWTDHTFNPWRGCTKISLGCAHCYAETMSGRNHGTLGVWGDKGTRVVASESMWREPVKWNKAAEKAGERQRVFCASLADVFEDWTGPMVDSSGCRLVNLEGQWRQAGQWHHDINLTMDDVRVRLFRLISQTPNLDWLLLTKRPENISRALNYCGNYCETNDAVRMSEAWQRQVWLGVSVEDQQRADERIPLLLQTPAAVRFLSCEPLLGPVDLSKVCYPHVARSGYRTLHDTNIHDVLLGEICSERSGCMVDEDAPAVDWVIVGGESGPNARPCNVAWVRSIIQQCRAAGVACFVKQLGSHVVCRNDDVADWFDLPGLGYLQLGPTERFQGAEGRVFGLNDKKGGNPDEWPEDLRVRQFPVGKAVHA